MIAFEDRSCDHPKGGAGGTSGGIGIFFIFEGLGKIRWFTDPSILAGQLNGWLHAVPSGSLSQIYLQRIALSTLPSMSWITIMFTW